MNGKISKNNLIIILIKSNLTFGKKKKRNQDWFDDQDKEIQALLKDKTITRNELQSRVRVLKNTWFTKKADEAEKFHLENNDEDFYAALRVVYGPTSKSSHPIRTKDGELLTSPEKIKDR
jgi:hypothetical protein